MADLTETFVGGVAPHQQKSGQGVKTLAYTATKAAQNDTVTLGDFGTVLGAYVEVVATGVHEPVTIATNVLTLTSATTGAVRILAWGY